jgi:hypothetical protein
LQAHRSIGRSCSASTQSSHLSLFVAAVYSIGDRVLNDVDQKPRPLQTMVDEIFERILLGRE